ncbi:MAG: hypothetical protein IPO80_12925 [Propionibacteriaceae bacterium]|nr:hypothetical protein [Propionibacteriaceae bacterium]
MASFLTCGHRLAALGPSPPKGVATRNQAEQVLGLTRLHMVAGIVRPRLDLTRPTRGDQR